ncbi:MAG: hypothetical protein AAGC76_04960 [Luteibacter sp.]|uniref:hypothetical protein n=1 Tax=Luteibacter sp. TaxID=1886636 RepID=UPI0028088F7B|nr:hypothetical protein [Luteibacter sp.]MDQ7995186.1 hypothetical protein [Luteibacter sp.]
MTIEEFSSLAFPEALGRCTAEAAKGEADRALLLCVLHWQRQEKSWSTAPVLGARSRSDVAHFQSLGRNDEQEPPLCQR